MFLEAFIYTISIYCFITFIYETPFSNSSSSISRDYSCSRISLDWLIFILASTPTVGPSIKTLS